LHIVITVVHIVVCILMVLVVLLQKGKGASMGAAFGGSSQTIFGSSGPGTFLGKITTGVAVVFMLTSLYLAYFAVHKERPSLMEGTAKPGVEQPVGQPTAPAPLPASPAGNPTAPVK
jgi:preprotein translocase subunit SecG